MPLTFGGWVRTLDDIKQLLNAGVEKVSINTQAVRNSAFIKEAAEAFGSQSIIVSIDVKRGANGEYEIFGEGGSHPTGMDPVEFSQCMEEYGAGEIFLNSIDRDGTMSGYDLELIKKVSMSVSIPVIACGGAGHPSDFLKVIHETEASAVAAGNIFHFSEHSPMLIKSFLRREGIDLRKATSADYRDVSFMEDGRIGKRDENYLEKLKYQVIREEVI